MADIQKIKIGADNPDSIMFDTYYVPIANKDLKLETIVAKDNSSMTENPEGTWEINNDWDVEFIDNGKTIRINKFKIDTWGIRHKVSSSSDNSTKYKNIQCKIEGLTYVNQNVIKANAGSEEVTGFTNAYCGDVGYIVEWYPGQSTSGRFVKGLVIQGQPIYSDIWNNSRDCSYAMSRAPWEVNTVRDQMVTDGIRPVGMMTGGGCSGFCIGIFGGVQNATEHLDNANGAYRIYDISDHPILIYLNVLDATANIDVSTVECWDAYAENTQVWHKDKTVENCLMKYRLMIPNDYKLLNTFFESDDNITWITPTKFRINRIPAEGLNISGAFTTINGNYVTINSSALSVRLAGLPSGSTAKFVRNFENTNAADDIEIILTNNSVTQIPAVNKTVYKAEEAENILYCEGNIVITGECSECNAIVELIPQYTSDGVLKIDTDTWLSFVSNIIVPQVTDLLNYITRTKFAMKPANPEVWDEIKTWYENNTGVNSNFYGGNVFNGSAGLKEITIKMSDWGYQFGEDNFANSEIETINFIQPVKNAHFTSPQRLLRSARNLKNINITWAEPDADDNYLCSANSIVDGMSNLTCETYPERFINWENNRSNISEGILCTLFQYCFNASSGLVTIPAFPGDREEANTIVPANILTNSFNDCTSLVTVGPILNIILCTPNSAQNVFRNCNKLASIKIKNLNHGSWNFDNETRDGNYHGTLKALNQESVQYLFTNLSDLTTHNPEVHENIIDKSFKNWSSDYKESISQISNWDYTLLNIFTFRCRRRYANANSAALIVSTNQALENMQINISGLQEGDSVVFGANNAEPIATFDTDGNHTVTKESGTSMGFKLVSANTEDRTEVQIAIVNGLDNTNPRVSAANLYCPTEWDSYITPQMITAANAKGWTIYVGGTVKNA